MPHTLPIIVGYEVIVGKVEHAVILQDSIGDAFKKLIGRLSVRAR